MQLHEAAEPSQGAIRITTEMGKLDIEPCQIAVVQRGIRFAVTLHEPRARGYVLEVFDGHFRIPDMGPIGAGRLPHALSARQAPTTWHSPKTLRPRWRRMKSASAASA